MRIERAAFDRLAHLLHPEEIGAPATTAFETLDALAWATTAAATEETRVRRPRLWPRSCGDTICSDRAEPGSERRRKDGDDEQNATHVTIMAEDSPYSAADPMIVGRVQTRSTAGAGLRDPADLDPPPVEFTIRSRTNTGGEALATTNSESNSSSAIVIGSVDPAPFRISGSVFV